ncbi:alanine racemase [Yoonia sediminilitoris]|uniref:alanine racemase n=1 Tax=Yoonia sediminilitoris TaxID=1286148 RepID=A0A2T6KCP0_9RHOB|nr:alanine racemase [Yoonia sediminilitoris]PUB12731.1 alanine racemase [Yoonia sediminilitoris]RCW94210.1 alanine racemase [Yoonia sediminilitoris]
MAQMSEPSAWCLIDRDRISRNLELALGLLPQGVRFCAVLKADAYGHGIAQVVPLLREQGVPCIGITSNAEARAVRAAGFTGTMIRLRAATPQEIKGALKDGVEEQVGSLATARQLRAIHGAAKTISGLHLALNADGMSRDGLEIATKAGQQECLQILDEIGQRIVGVCTHFPANDPEPLQESAALFTQQVSWVCDNSQLERSALLSHAGSTLTLLSGVPVGTDMYRCGAILYGFLKPELGFLPTMELQARVVQVGDYPAGSSVGYDRDSRLEADRRLACISIGYAGGYGRIAQDRGAVLIRDQLAPVLGKVSMNTIVADVSDIAAAQIGDVATVFGGSGPQAIGPDRATAQFGTILPDLFSDWGMRNPRIYRDHKGC